ncbi:MAG TPA: DUF1583 domain-containing protein [Gemmataceae bacterium]|nr:DUF1583 domain-containing protein [Gemmataceae bacterium]
MIPPDLKSNGQSTGVRSTFGVAGDFEITVSFEVLAEPPPPNPYKRARFTLTICPASPDGAEASMSHRLRMKQAADFQAWNRLWSEKSKKNEISSKFTPTKVKAGRFRLVRNGTTLQYYASEGDKGEFALLHKCSFPDSDLTQLVISAAAEEPGAALGVRVHDLRIRGKSLPNLQAQPVIAPVQAQSPAPVAQPSAPSSEGKSHIWLIAALAIGLVLCALALLALVLLWRRAAG